MAVLLGGTAFAALRFVRSEDVSVVDVDRGFAARSASAAEKEATGLCPWRQPEEDRRRFFPDATGARDETLVLSRERAAVAQLLGRPPAAQENALQIHRILRQNQGVEAIVGTIVTRCVAGESGLIELALAVDTNGAVRGARLQRLREPEAVARELQSDRFLGAFRGKTRASSWKLKQDFPDVSPAAHSSASALLDGARTALILLHVGEQILHNDRFRSGYRLRR